MEITKNHIENAKRILPMADKIAIIKGNAEECIEKYELGNDDGIFYYIEDTFAKELILSKVLLSNYLEIMGIDEVLTVDLYDEYFENNPLNQLERLKSKFKSDKEFELVEKIFDICTDYNKFCKMFNIEVYGILQAKNNSIKRNILGKDAIDLIANKISDRSIEVLSEKISSQITPERMKESMTELKDIIINAKETVSQIKEQNIPQEKI